MVRFKDISKENQVLLAGILVLAILFIYQNKKANEITGEAACEISRVEAEEIAGDWLESKDIDWGEAESVEYFDAIQEYHRQEFHVHYGETDKEGSGFVIDASRTIVINCISGEVREGLSD